MKKISNRKWSGWVQCPPLRIFLKENEKHFYVYLDKLQNREQMEYKRWKKEQRKRKNKERLEILRQQKIKGV